MSSVIKRSKQHLKCIELRITTFEREEETENKDRHLQLETGLQWIYATCLLQSVRHVREPETLHVRDSVVVKALDGTCNYGKVTRIFLDDNTGNLMASVLWYYNAEQIETDPATVSPPIADKELFASRHIDVVPLDTIEEIIFVITFNEFARAPKTAGNLMASVLWYYNAEQIETDPATVSPPIADKELFASRHIDVVPLDTIEEIIFVITFNEFARYMAENKIDALPRAQRPREEDEIWSRGENGYPRRTLLPCEDTPVELVSIFSLLLWPHNFKVHSAK
uniref:BAH domain-containing protein n=1 Tax=Ascaris lumbricoides TaxID=6252 RepID=A0A0M3IU65_ASCLU